MTRHQADRDQSAAADAAMRVMREQPANPRPCSVAAALEVLGERWSLLVVRELGYGVRTFTRIVTYTGAPRDILASRLRKLEEAGVIERRLYSEHPRRFEYHLTQAGRDLLPVMNALRAWGDRYAVEQPALQVWHDCGHELEMETICRHCGSAISPAAMIPIPRGVSLLAAQAQDRQSHHSRPTSHRD